MYQCRKTKKFDEAAVGNEEFDENKPSGCVTLERSLKTSTPDSARARRTAGRSTPPSKGDLSLPLCSMSVSMNGICNVVELVDAASTRTRRTAEFLRFYSAKSTNDQTLLKGKLECLSDFYVYADFLTKTKSLTFPRPSSQSTTSPATPAPKAVEGSPLLETLMGGGFEIPLLVGTPIDERAITQLKELDDKKFVCAPKDSSSWRKSKSARRIHILKNALCDGVEKVAISNCQLTRHSFLSPRISGENANMAHIRRERDSLLSRYMASRPHVSHHKGPKNAPSSRLPYSGFVLDGPTTFERAHTE